MFKKVLLFGLASGLSLATLSARAQATLATSPYTETFDNLASGLPAGFGVYLGATASSLGTAPTSAQLILTQDANTAWTNTTGGFKNYASATGAPTDQATAPNRALGVRQTGNIGDPGAAFVFQAANTTGKTDFVLSFKLQSLDAASPRTTTWRVDYALGAAPTAFTSVGTGGSTGNSTLSNNTITVNFGSALDNQTGPVYIRIVTLTGSIGASNRPSSAIDDFSLTWSAPTSTTPALTVAPTALSFGGQNINTTSAARQYSLTGANLTGATTLTATGPFTVSKDNTTFGTTLSYTPADLTAAQTVYVKFAPTATGAATGSITHASTGATTRTVALTGTGTDPNQTVFDFATCTTALSNGWSQVSVTGPQVWGCTTFGRDPNNPTATTATPNGVQINGFASGNIENEDWFISPGFDLTTYNFPLFSFWSRTAFNGPALKLRVSTNYSGTGAPSAATWTELNVPFPTAGSDVWTQTANINLAAFKAARVHVAFVYTSTTSAAARWTLDDIVLTQSATAPAPTLFTSANRLAFGYQAVGTSADRTLTVSANDLTNDVTLTSSNANFTLSKDGTAFTPTLTLTRAEVNGTNKAVTVRFLPTTAATNVSGALAISTTGATSASVALTGDTYDPAKTLEVVTWNVEWFGSADPNLGPRDKELQRTNVASVMNLLRADVYALQEVVDTLRLRNLAAQISTTLGVPYGYKTSEFGSYSDDKNDPDYASAQKLSFIYRTDVLTNPSFTGLLRCTEAQNCPAYNPWASGRFPYLMSANVTLDGITKRVNFVVIHAKANATATSANDHARRKAGADLLKNLLDTSYANDNTLIVGDYNDVLEGTIATGVTPAVSSYNSFMQDVNYVPLTLPLAQAGLQSTAGFKTVIDNVIANRNMAQYYINGTAAIRTDVAATIPSYSSTTSDHYPVFTRFSFTSAPLRNKAAHTTTLGLYPNPVTNSVRLEVPETGANLSLQVYTTTGRLVYQGTGSVEQLNQQLNQRVGNLTAGLYMVRVIGAKQTYANRFQKQ
ncbi:T9SS-dependent choice-of-anchor J family protein [Hymenobacter arizonensis]|nr:choice-of-anchor J domain-containing protein [Hymenobacter arizonensis]